MSAAVANDAANAGVTYAYRRIEFELSHYFAQGTLARLYEDQSANGVWTFSATVRF